MKGEFYFPEYLPTQPAESSKIRKHAEDLFHKYSDPSYRTEKANFLKFMQSITNEIVGIEPKKVKQPKKIETGVKTEKLFIPSGLKVPCTDALKNFRALREELSAEIGHSSIPHASISRPELGPSYDRQSSRSSESSTSPVQEELYEDESLISRPMLNDKWFYPKVNSSGDQSSATTTVKVDDESIQSSISSVSVQIPLKEMKICEEKECQTLETELAPSLPAAGVSHSQLGAPHSTPPSTPTPEIQQNLLKNPPFISLPPSPAPFHVTPPPMIDAADECCDTDEEDNAPITRPVQAQTQHTEVPTSPLIHPSLGYQRPYQYEEKWFLPTLHAHSPSSSIRSDQEKENQSIQSSLSSHSHRKINTKVPNASKVESTNQSSRPLQAEDVIHIDAPHTRLNFTPHEINVERKSSATYLPQPFAPIQRDYPHSYSKPSTTLARPPPLQEKTPNSHPPPRVLDKPIPAAYSAPKDTLDLSNLSFEMIQHLHIPTSSLSHSSYRGGYRKR